MFIKVCGITRASDGVHAVQQGATAIGFVFWPRSPRAVTPDGAAAIVDELPRNVAKAFRNGTRSEDGRPGKNYWQNTAKYTISISAAPPNRTVSGTEDIVYTNNSPETLQNVVIRLELNSHHPQAPREGVISANYLTTGVHIDQYVENGKEKKWKEGPGSTWQNVKLDQKLVPHASITLSFKWHYEVSVESGREGAPPAKTTPPHRRRLPWIPVPRPRERPASMPAYTS